MGACYPGTMVAWTCWMCDASVPSGTPHYCPGYSSSLSDPKPVGNIATDHSAEILEELRAIRRLLEVVQS